jgi:hypothetical protein
VRISQHTAWRVSHAGAVALGRAAHRGLSINARAALQQQAHDVEVAVLCSMDQRCVSILRASVNAHTGVARQLTLMRRLWARRRTLL